MQFWRGFWGVQKCTAVPIICDGTKMFSNDFELAKEKKTVKKSWWWDILDLSVVWILGVACTYQCRAVMISFTAGLTTAASSSSPSEFIGKLFAVQLLCNCYLYLKLCCRYKIFFLAPEADNAQTSCQ